MSRVRLTEYIHDPSAVDGIYFAAAAESGRNRVMSLLVESSHTRICSDTVHRITGVVGFGLLTYRGFRFLITVNEYKIQPGC